MPFNDKALEVMRRQHEVLGKIIWREEEWRRQDRLRRSSSTLTDMTVPLNPLIPTELQTPAPSSPPCGPPEGNLTNRLGKHALGPLLLLIMANNTHMSGLLETQGTLLKKLSESLISQNN